MIELYFLPRPFTMVRMTKATLGVRHRVRRWWVMLGIAGWLLSYAVPALLAAETGIQIGDTTITVPTPSGFTPVTKDMARLDEVLETFVATSNTRFISFIPTQMVPEVQGGQVPDLPRTLSLQTTKKMVTPVVTTSQFNEVKVVIREQNQELLKQAEQQMPGLLERAQRKLGGQSPTDLTLKIDRMAPLPPHEDGERSLAYSMRLNLATEVAGGQTINHPAVVTTTLVHARGKLFFLYVNGGADDLEWTRQTAREWTTALLAANPSDAATRLKESIRPGAVDWGHVLRNAIFGGIIGGVVGLIRVFVKRKSSG